jgi:hypothetical protein
MPLLKELKIFINDLDYKYIASLRDLEHFFFGS